MERAKAVHEGALDDAPALRYTPCLEVVLVPCVKEPSLMKLPLSMLTSSN
jgi:hypothetical protein